MALTVNVFYKLISMVHGWLFISQLVTLANGWAQTAYMLEELPTTEATSKKNYPLIILNFLITNSENACYRIRADLMN